MCTTPRIREQYSFHLKEYDSCLKVWIRARSIVIKDLLVTPCCTTQIMLTNVSIMLKNVSIMTKNVSIMTKNVSIMIKVY